MTALTTMPKTIEGLSEQQLLQVYKHMQFDEYKTQLSAKIKQMEFNASEKVEQWLKNKAHHTTRMYRLYVNDFITFLGDKSILEVDPYFVDSVVVDYLQAFGEAKGKAVYNCLSSFFSSLVLWGDVNMNPLKGVGLKFPARIHEYSLMTDEDLECIKMYFDKPTVAHEKMRMAIHIMSEYGVRVGFFNSSLEVRGNKIYSFNKGKMYEITVDNYVLDRIEIVKQINGVTVQSMFRYCMNNLEGVLQRKYSPHDFRNLYAVKEYMKDKDIYKLSKMLNHSSVVVTQVYLKGLNFKGE